MLWESFGDGTVEFPWDFFTIYVPSGYVNSLLLKMAIEIVSFPINSMVIFHSYVSLPQGMDQNASENWLKNTG